METTSGLRDRIDFNTVDGIRSFKPHYDSAIDYLLLQVSPVIPAVSVDWDGDFWVRIVPETGYIVGIGIEDFKGFFRRKYRTLINGKSATDPIIKELIITLLKSGPKPYTKKTFMADLQRVAQKVRV